MKKGNISEKIIEYARLKANSEDLSTKSEEELKNNRIQTREEQRNIHNKAEEIREQELQDRAEWYIVEENLPIGEALKITIE